jgi:glutamate 5-kinase
VGKKIVIKVGSSTLTTTQSKIDYEFLHTLAAQIAQVRKIGWQPVIVTSASIACGLEALGITTRPTDMPSLQAAASVGQNALSTAYAEAFVPFDIITSVVLITRRDTADRQAYLHARDTFSKLLQLGVIPIVNENDTVSVEQIRFGDNDTLAALVACLIDADLVVMLSDVEGLFDKNPHNHSGVHLISHVDRIDEELMSHAGEAGSVVGSGGMITKITAARVLMVAGIEMVICNGKKPDVLLDIVKGLPIGTRFKASKAPHAITPKKLWLALGDSARGCLIVDTGAKTALIAQGSSLLGVGIVSVEGVFDAGDIIDIKDRTGHLFARGKVAQSSKKISLALGSAQKEVKKNATQQDFKDLTKKPIVHRDELVVFE